MPTKNMVLHHDCERVETLLAVLGGVLRWKDKPMKTFWLSFVDDTGFLGVCIVHVEDAEVAVCRLFLLPQSQDGAEWVMAAVKKAHTMGCNPGGEVLAVELPEPLPEGLPLYRILDREEAEAFFQ